LTWLAPYCVAPAALQAKAAQINSAHPSCSRTCPGAEKGRELRRDESNAPSSRVPKRAQRAQGTQQMATEKSDAWPTSKKSPRKALAQNRGRARKIESQRFYARISLSYELGCLRHLRRQSGSENDGIDQVRRGRCNRRFPLCPPRNWIVA